MAELDILMILGKKAARRDADRFARLGEQAHQSGDIARSLFYYRKALALHEQLGPASVEVAWCLDRVGAAEFRLGDYAGSVGTLTRAVALRRALDMPPHLIEALISLGLSRLQLGDLDAAEGDLEEAWTVAEHVMPRSAAVGIILGHLGNVAMRREQFERASRYCTESLDIAFSIDPRSRDTALAFGKLGVVARQMGDHVEAIRLQRESLRLLRRLRWPKDIADALTNLGRALCENGQVDEAYAALEEADMIFNQVAPNVVTHGLCLHLLAQIHSRRGDEKRGRELRARGARILGS